jgi:hypothetical protein
MNRLLTAALVAAAAGAHAGEPISLLVPVTYADYAGVLLKNRKVCALDEELAKDIGAEIEHRAQRPGTTQSAAGPVLKVAIVGSDGIGGGGWTGPKSLSVRAELVAGDTVLGTKTVTRRGRSGLAGAFEGTCGILRDLSADIARDIVAWSGTSTSPAQDDALRAARMPAAAAPATPPASGADS